jgi:hypothetical protein
MARMTYLRRRPMIYGAACNAPSRLCNERPGSLARGRFDDLTGFLRISSRVHFQDQVCQRRHESQGGVAGCQVVRPIIPVHASEPLRYCCPHLVLPRRGVQDGPAVAQPGPIGWGWQTGRDRVNRRSCGRRRGRGVEQSSIARRDGAQAFVRARRPARA